MSDNDVTKEMLITKGVAAGLGDDKFLRGLSIENLSNVVAAVEARDGEIEGLKKKVPDADKKNKNITTVADLVKAGRIKVRPVSSEKEEEDDEESPKEKKKAGKNENKDKA